MRSVSQNSAYGLPDLNLLLLEAPEPEFNFTPSVLCSGFAVTMQDTRSKVGGCANVFHLPERMVLGKLFKAPVRQGVHFQLAE